MTLAENFCSVFHTAPTAVYRAPARINLIGEHIDYCGGLVLPAAVSLYMNAAISPRDDDCFSIASTDVEERLTARLSEIAYRKENGWGNYVFGMIKTLANHGKTFPTGLNILISSEIPLGSGLSSSAALLVLVAFALNDLFSLSLDARDVALLAKECENDFCGLKSGIMDEAAIALGKEDHCLLLNCHDFTYRYFDVHLPGYTFAVLKTNKPRKLTESKYNERVAECTRALEILQKHYDVQNLSQLPCEDLGQIERYLGGGTLAARVRHIVTENKRVKDFVAALGTGDIPRLGEILNASHASLQNDYEVSGVHLDAITAAAPGAPLRL